MGKLTNKFNGLSAGRQFVVLFSICFIILLPVIPLTIHSDRRILQQLSDFQFLLFALVLCVGYAALLAVAGWLGANIQIRIIEKKSRTTPRTLRR